MQLTIPRVMVPRALPLIERLGFHGAQVAAYDPLLSAEEVEVTPDQVKSAHAMAEQVRPAHRSATGA